MWILWFWKTSREIISVKKLLLFILSMFIGTANGSPQILLSHLNNMVSPLTFSQHHDRLPASMKYNKLSECGTTNGPTKFLSRCASLPSSNPLDFCCLIFVSLVELKRSRKSRPVSAVIPLDLAAGLFMYQGLDRVSSSRTATSLSHPFSWSLLFLLSHPSVFDWRCRSRPLNCSAGPCVSTPSIWKL